MSRQLFDGKTLNGWHAVCRAQGDKTSEKYQIASKTTGRWEVIDGAIVGTQEIRGFGGYLLSDEKFADFELTFEANPDWPADTGIYIRTSPIGTQGFQILIDHRRSGGIGGFYGNGIGNFHAVTFYVDAVKDSAGNAIGMKIHDDPATVFNPVTPEKRALLSYAIKPEDFIKTWRWKNWNEFRIRCVGEYPVLTTWINGVKAYEMDSAKIVWPNYDKDAALKILGRAGHIALEVHPNDPGLGDERWAPGAACRWRNFTIDVL